jgi:hypothetical protein
MVSTALDTFTSMEKLTGLTRFEQEKTMTSAAIVKLWDAIAMVTYLTKTCGMALHDACRIAGTEHNVDTVQLYRIMTD